MGVRGDKQGSVHGMDAAPASPRAPVGTLILLYVECMLHLKISPCIK